MGEGWGEGDNPAFNILILTDQHPDPTESGALASSIMAA